MNSKKIIATLVAATMVIPSFAMTVFADVEEDTNTGIVEEVQEGVVLDDVNFPDSTFRSYIASSLAVEEGDTLTLEMCDSLKAINLGFTDVASLEGIDNFKRLSSIDISYCTNLESLDLSGNNRVEFIAAYNSGIKTLTLGDNSYLFQLFIEATPLTAVDISGCDILASLYAESEPEYDSDLLCCYIADELSFFSFNEDLDITYEKTYDPVGPDVPDMPVVETGVAGFAERLYTCALKRESDPKGKEDWINALEEGTFNGAQAAQAFLFSQEVQEANITDEDFIERLYATFMDREPDQAGFDTWMNAINEQGWTREQVFMGFVDSQEWANVCFKYDIVSGGAATPDITLEPSEAIIAFATRLYTTCLCREGDAEGIKNWSDFLVNRKMTGSQAASSFFFSEEFIAQEVSDGEYVDRLYATFMNREADKEGRDMWVDLLASGEWTREMVLDGFAQSDEFKNICKDAGIKP